MAIFLVVPTLPSEALQPHLKALQDEEKIKYHVLPRGEFLVSYKGASQELSDLLGISNGSIASGVVASINSYYGFAGNNIWEWLSAHWES